MNIKEKIKIINKIIEVEGGYVNDPSDSGAETNFGITRKIARENMYVGHMCDMPQSVAFDIYAKQYWHSVRGDDLLELSESVAAEVVDTAVNAGQGTAGKFLQRSLNVLNKGGSIYPDVLVDGIIGSGTISALKAYLKVHDAKILMRMLNALQGAYYVKLAERREKDERFIYGWFKNRVSMINASAKNPEDDLVVLEAGGGVPPKPK